MAGAGNDFIMIDACSSALKLDWPLLAEKWCRPKTGIGADGLIVLEPDTSSDFLMRIFNADGSEAEMCGNGARCSAIFAHSQGLAGSAQRFRTGAGVIGARVEGDDAAIEMTDPASFDMHIGIDIERQPVTVHFVNTGVPHAVLFTHRLDDEPVDRTGPLIRRHARFSPAGTNVDFVQVASWDAIRVRTFERGVEAETLACGTGAVASAVVAHRLGMITATDVAVHMRGGTLRVRFRPEGSLYRDVWLAGPVITVFKGEIEVPS